MRGALLQLCSGDDPAQNLMQTLGHIRDAAAAGAKLVLTPECTNLISLSRSYQAEVLRGEEDDPTLAGLRDAARDLSLWLVIGSLCLRAEDGERFVNRSFLIGPDGRIVARYDKIHMFDVTLAGGERYHESAAYRPGAQAKLAEIDGFCVGLSICYDLRFPGLYRALARSGATVLTVPSAFTQPTGAAHWHVLLRARAIETGCYVLAPAQCGTHPAQHGKSRRTYGHSLVVSPWGEVLADAGPEALGPLYFNLESEAIARARAAVPSLEHDRDFSLPL